MEETMNRPFIDYDILLKLFEMSRDPKKDIEFVAKQANCAPGTARFYLSMFKNIVDGKPIPGSTIDERQSFFKVVDAHGYKVIREDVPTPAILPEKESPDAKAKAEADALNTARFFKNFGELMQLLEDILEEEKHQSEQLNAIVNSMNANADNLFDKVRGISETVTAMRKRNG